MSAADRVLIVGAGPIGLICAYRLSLMDIPVTIVDKAAEIPTDLRASTWHPATLDMLEELGVTDVILKKGAVCPSWQYRFQDTGERAVFDLSVLAGETGHPYRVQCEQFHVVRHLAEVVASRDNVDLRWGVEAVGVAQDDNGVTLTVVGNGEEETLKGRFLIGADGGRSNVRDQLGLGFDGKTYPIFTMVAITDFPFEKHYEGLSNVSYVWTETGNFSLLRVPDRWRSGITPRPDQTPEDALSDENINAHFQRIVPRDQRYEILARGSYRTHMRVTERFNVGRVFLAGDAAHLNTPNGGLGLNCGVHDAMNLSEKIHAVWHGRADMAVFDRYTRQRKLIATDYVHTMSDANHHRMRERDPQKRRAIMQDMQRVTADDALMKDWLMNSSMINAVRFAETID
ncbi:MAG: NAD(P)/FAD-dependent oxidoreductase [Alphaproteobacteria bacterium]